MGLGIRTQWRRIHELGPPVWRAIRCGACGPAVDRRLGYLFLYTTTRCNSKCLHCNFWEKPITDLPIEALQRTVASPLVDERTFVILGGGEFPLYPHWHEAIDACRKVGTLCIQTNGLMPERIQRIAEYAGNPMIMVSVDGGPQTYHRMRGVDGYHKVLKTIQALHERYRMVVSFTFSPWTSLEDYYHVRQLCRDYGLTFGPNFYSPLEYFGTTDQRPSPIPYTDQLPTTPDELPVTNLVKLYDAWTRGELYLPCLGIFDTVVVYPNGDVPLCLQRYEPLGNVVETPLETFWLTEETLDRMRANRTCNGCWTGSYRHRDEQVVRHLDGIIGSSWARRLFGPGFAYNEISTMVEQPTACNPCPVTTQEEPVL